MATTTHPHVGERWRARRWSSWTLRVAIFAAPILAAISVSLWLARHLFEPVGAGQVVTWWAILIGCSSLVAWGVDRLARRLLPLTVMLKMTMLFPDRAPPRYRVALRRPNVSELRRRVAEAETDGDPRLGEAAGLILSLAAALNHHDRKTRGHGERTRAYADMLAEELKIPEDGREKLRWAALLHDIGKLEVPAEILNKDGPLDEEEREIIRQHPLMGMEVAAPLIPWLGEWAGAIEHHHEWWDGSGYPRGLAGEEISLSARIVSVADAYDVMTSGRAYQAPKSPEEARREIATMAGTQFDPTVARALMNISLGRLRWMLGPMTWLGQIPFFLDRLGRDFVTVSTAATVTAAAMVSGVVPVPASITNWGPAGGGQVSAPAPTPAVAPPGMLEGDGTPPPGPGTQDPNTTLPPAEDPTTTTTIPTTTTGPTTTTIPTTTTGPTTTTSTIALPPAPVANPDVATTDAGEPVTVDVAANDTPAGLIVDGITTPPSSGTATIVSNRIRYTPRIGFSGTDTFGYRVCDAHSRCASSTVAVRVIAANQAPVAVDDSATTPAGSAVSIAVLANDHDPDGDPLSLDRVWAPAHGSAGIDGTRIVYTPQSGFVGTDSFEYRVCDPHGACDTATVTVTVTSPYSPPNAVDDEATTNPGGRVMIDVLANDTDPDGDLVASTLTITTPPTSGSATVTGGGKVRYAAAQGFVGVVTFVYRICDATGLCDTATVTVTISR